MKKDIVCFICPNSCVLSISGDEANLRIENNRCSRGIDFALKELRDPERTLTSTMRTRNGVLPLVSVRSDKPVKKVELREIISRLDAVTIDAPVASGQVLMESVGINKVNIIATRSVAAHSAGDM
jgi:CxxC motif-containing protein